MVVHSSGSADVHTSISAAQQAIQDSLGILGIIGDQVSQRQDGREKEVIENIVSLAVLMMNHAKDAIDAAVGLQKELGMGTDGQKVSDAEYKLRQRKWIADLQGCLDAVVEGTPVWLECVRQVSGLMMVFRSVSVRVCA